MIHEQEQMLEKIKDIAGNLIESIVKFEGEEYETGDDEEKALCKLVEKVKYKISDMDKATHWFKELNSALSSCRSISSKRKERS